jgi:hypothetical protein
MYKVPRKMYDQTLLMLFIAHISKRKEINIMGRLIFSPRKTKLQNETTALHFILFNTCIYPLQREITAWHIVLNICVKILFWNEYPHLMNNTLEVPEIWLQLVNRHFSLLLVPNPFYKNVRLTIHVYISKFFS